MTPSGGNNILELRLENMEKRQDDRHRENTAALTAIFKKLDPVVSDMQSLCGNDRHPGRVGLAERTILEHAAQLDGLKDTVTRWSAVLAFLIFVLGLGVPILEHFWK